MASKSWTDAVDFEALRRDLEAMPHRKKKAYQEDFARRLGISYSTLRRELARRFGKAKDMTRQEEIPDHIVRRVAEIKEEYKTMTLKEDGRTLATRDAQEIAEAEGVEGATDWHQSTVDAALRRRGYHVKEPRRRIEPAYAGQQFQMDFSRSKHFQIEEPVEGDVEGAGDWLLRATARELHYKDASAKVRAWIAQLRDEYSRLRLIRYYPATQESASLGMHFLRWCFQRPEDEHLMRELPERLKVDSGSFGKAKMTRRGLDRLGIELRLTSPGNAASQGKVERGFRTLWGYEAKIATQLLRQGEQHIRLSRLRGLVHRLMIQEQDKRHPVRRHKTRGALYQQSLLRRPLRTVGTDLRDLFTRTWERRADDTCMISIGGKPYEVPPFAAGHWVLVHRRTDGAMAGELLDGWRAGEPFEVKPYDFEDLDDWESRPRQTYAQEIAEEVRAQKRRRQKAEKKTKVRNLKPSRPDEEVTSPFDDTAEEGRPLQLVEARARASRLLQQRMELSREKAAGLAQRLAHSDILFEGMTLAAVEREIEDIIQRARATETEEPDTISHEEGLQLLEDRLEADGIGTIRRRTRLRLAEDQGLIYEDMPRAEVDDAYEAVTGTGRRAATG